MIETEVRIYFKEPLKTRGKTAIFLNLQYAILEGKHSYTVNIYRYEYHFVRNLYLYLHKRLRGKVRKISALNKKVDNFTILLSFSTTFSSDSYTLFQSEGKQRSPPPTQGNM